MKLGIDFGTTRIVVAAADRGNYPILSFDTPEGHADWFPPLVALRGGQQRFGWDAWAAQAEPEWTVVRSVKRILEDAGPETRIEVDGNQYPLLDLLCGLVAALRQALPPDAHEVMLGVPANANSNQRFLTVEAFRRAGFEVLGLLNEPSAAAIEFGHRHKLQGKLLVYDLGGGTFDASLVELDEKTHTVVASEGIATLGGDDFDELLGEIAAGQPVSTLTTAELFRLHEECRRQKEALHPNTRKIVVDLDQVREGWGQATIPASTFYEFCRPLVEETIRATAKLASQHDLEALYVTGGGSELPIVARLLREEFGRRVRRSAYTRSATAIGLAIQADAASGYTLREVFSRTFGVWRENEAGRVMAFDAIFPKGTRLPGPGEDSLDVRRRYRPVHNIGHFRYLEASHLDPQGQPAGDISIWDEIRFPFDPALEDVRQLDRQPIEHSHRAAIQQVEEQYACDATGRIRVEIHNRTSHHRREYMLARWSSEGTCQTVASPKKSRRAGR